MYIVRSAGCEDVDCFFLRSTGGGFLAPGRFLTPEYPVVAEDLGAVVDFVELFVELFAELRETAI
jgi:hypothetical protein